MSSWKWPWYQCLKSVLCFNFSWYQVLISWEKNIMELEVWNCSLMQKSICEDKIHDGAVWVSTVSILKFTFVSSFSDLWNFSSVTVSWDHQISCSIRNCLSDDIAPPCEKIFFHSIVKTYPLSNSSILSESIREFFCSASVSLCFG